MLKTKKYNQLVIIVVIGIIAVLLTSSYIITQHQIDTIKQNQYNNFSLNIKSSLNKMIHNKQQLTTFIALALAQNTTIIKALEQNNNQLINIKYLSSLIDQKSTYKNLWYQVIDKNGNSFFRSWTKKTGDNLLQARPEISSIIENPEVLSTISTGKFAMTFKSMVPIYDDNENFIGIFEVISHFNSIVNQLLKEDNVYSIFLVNKTYKHQITKPLTKLFINNYYVTNENTNENILNMLRTKGVKHYLDTQNHYKIDTDCGYLVVTYEIPDINGKDMGYALIFKPLETIEISKAIYMKNNSALLISLLIIITVLLGYSLIYRKHQKYIIEQYEKHQQDLVKSIKFQTIGEMAAGITHEINTPLTYIKGTIEIARLDLSELPASKIKNKLTENLNIVYNGTKRIAMIIESMKEMAQSTISKKIKVNVYSTLLVVLRMIYSRSKLITPIYINGELFTLDISNKTEDKYFAKIHVQRIEQVWTIILNNAIDELQKIKEYEKRRIDINIYQKDEKIIITFEDTAGGIPNKLISKIFEPFVSTKKSSGIGIGLNVAKKIIEEHNATIDVHNTKNGACFTVMLDKYSKGYETLE